MAHNPEVEGSNPSPATKARGPFSNRERAFCMWFANGFANEATVVDASEPPIISSANVLARPVVPAVTRPLAPQLLTPRGCGWPVQGRLALSCRSRSPSRALPAVASLRDGASATLEYARHGRSIGGESPLEEEVVLTPSRRQLRRREAGWEGSPGRIPAPRNTNRVGGWAIWVSLLKKAKPVTVNGVVT
jgi:hypothetical protein